MPDGSTSDTVLNGAKIAGSGIGLALIKPAVSNIMARKKRIQEASPWFSGTNFQMSWLKGYALGLPRLVLWIGYAFAAAALLFLALWLYSARKEPSQWPHLYRLLGTEKAKVLLTFIALLLGIVSAIALIIDQMSEFEILKFVFKKRESERRHANRVKAKTPGLFKIDPAICEKIAGYISQTLKDDPQYLTSMLFPELPDHETMANQLIFGALLEALEPKNARHDWGGISGISSAMFEELPLCSPAALRQLTPSEVSSRLADSIYTQNNWQLNQEAKNDLTELAKTLKKRYSGNGLRLLQAPRTKSPFPGWRLRDWIDWLKVRLFLTNSFHLVQSRLKRLPVYSHMSRARLGLAKFAFEYQILDVDPEDLELGKSPPILLILLRTGAVRTDIKTVATDDSDVEFFADQAMRRIARHLEVLLGKEKIYESWELVAGENYPYNIVDGFLFCQGADLERGARIEIPGVDLTDKTTHFDLNRTLGKLELKDGKTSQEENQPLT